MARHWAALLGLFVGVAVFPALGLPMLRDLFGPAALLATYAYIAFVAGTLTYAAIRWLTAWRADATSSDADRPAERDGTAGESDPLVDSEIDRLREEPK